MIKLALCIVRGAVYARALTDAKALPVLAVTIIGFRGATPFVFFEVVFSMSMPSKRGVALIANDEQSHRDDLVRNNFEPPNPQIIDCPSCKSRHLHYNFSCRGF